MRIMIMLTILTTSSFAFAIGHDTPLRYEWEAQIEKVEAQERKPSSYSTYSEKHPFESKEADQKFKLEYSDKEK